MAEEVDYGMIEALVLGARVVAAFADDKLAHAAQSVVSKGNFRLDHITKLEPTGESFPDEPERSLGQYLRSIGVAAED